MKKRIYAVILAIFIAVSAVIFVHADKSDTPALQDLVIDDMSTRRFWESDGLLVSRELYSDSTSHLASSEDDIGYIIFSSSEAVSETELTAKRTFDSEINLYKYSTLSFDYFVSEELVPALETSSDTSDSTSFEAETETGEASETASTEPLPMAKTPVLYTVTVTLYSGSSSISSSFAAVTGEWTKADIVLSGWNKRSSLDAVSISVTPTFDGIGITSPVSLAVDGITAHGEADTSHEDRFMTASFSVKDGSLTTYIDGSVLWRRTVYSSISANISYSEKDEAAGHNTLRAVLSVSTDTELRLTAIYEDGTVYEGKPQTVLASEGTSPGGGKNACYFSFPSPEKAIRFALVSDTRVGGTVTLFGIDTVCLPSASASEVSPLGTLDVCAFDANGALNLRGTVSSDAVIEHINGKILIYAVPLYRTVEDTVLSSDPITEADMTTRYNITVASASLPAGAAAMRYAVIISDGTSLIEVCSPSLPDTDKAGTVLPSDSDSIKGITNAKIDHAAGLTEITVDIGTIFGSPSSSKIYSVFGELYYFSSDILAELDASVKPLSLFGTKVYLRLIRTDGNGHSLPITANNVGVFRELYAVTDYLTSRYSSAEYGYISGIVIDDPTVFETEGMNAADTDKVSALVNAAAIIKGTASANISGFRVLFALGNKFLTEKPSFDSAELYLRILTYYASAHGLEDYGIVWQTDTVESNDAVCGVADVAHIMKYASTLGGTAPKTCFVRFSPAIEGYPTYDKLLMPTTEAYFAACAQSAVHGFIFDSVYVTESAVGADFDVLFAKMDTNAYKEAFSHMYGSSEAVPMPSSAAEKRTFTRTVGNIDAALSADTVGASSLFDYTDAFYTGGWFTLSSGGECITVKDKSGRTMRASGGIMYSCTSPLDLSSAPVLSFELYSEDTAYYTLTVLSHNAEVTSEFTVTPKSRRVYIDLSDFTGVSDITGLILRPKLSEAKAVYIKNISCESYLLTDSELTEIFDSVSDATGNDQTEPEENIVPIIAVISVATVISALVFSLLRRKEK